MEHDSKILSGIARYQGIGFGWTVPFFPRDIPKPGGFPFGGHKFLGFSAFHKWVCLF